MAEKLSEATWTDYCKKQKLTLDDKALLKALAGVDKAADEPEARVTALQEVVEQVKKQVMALAKSKKQLGEKAFDGAKDKLYEILGTAEKLQKDAQQALAAAGDEEADSPALLTTAMVPLVRVLQKGEVQMHAMIAVGPKRAAVLIMRRPIAPARRKLLAEYLEVTSGLKYIAADVAGKPGLVEFLLDAPVAGMAKKLRQALLDQTGLRTKVFVQFGEETETEEGEGEEGTPAEATGTSTAPPAPDDTPLRFAALLKKLQPAIAAATAAGGPAAPDIKLLASEVGALGRAKNFARGLQLLQQLEGLLGQAGVATPASPATTAAPATPDVAAAPAGQVAPGVAFTQTRLLWDQTRKKVQSELRKLEASILEACKDEPDAAEIAAGTRNLYTVLDFLDERLIDKLDDALNASDPAVRKQRNDEAREIVEEYVDFVESEDLMQDIDDNGFTGVAIKSTLTTSLKAIGQRLRA